jgi:hypothetical protein
MPTTQSHSDVLGPLHRERLGHEQPMRVPRFTAIEKLHFPTVTRAVEPDFTSDGRTVGRTHELEEQPAQLARTQPRRRSG